MWTVSLRRMMACAHLAGSLQGRLHLVLLLVAFLSTSPRDFAGGFAWDSGFVGGIWAGPLGSGAAEVMVSDCGVVLIWGDGSW